MGTTQTPLRSLIAPVLRKRIIGSTVAALGIVGCLGAGAAPPSLAATGDTAICSYYLVGKALPGYTNLALPSPTSYRFTGAVTCQGQAQGRDLPTKPGTMTFTGQSGPASSCAFGLDQVHTEITYAASDFAPARPASAQRDHSTRNRHRHRGRRHRQRHAKTAASTLQGGDGMRLTGDQVWTWVTYGGLFYGQLGGAQIIGQLGGGGDPDGHYGSCNQSDPYIDTAVSGRFVLFDAQTGHGIDHQHVITGTQFLPSGTLAAGLAKNAASPYGDPNLDPSTADQLLVNYPVTQGDRITFTNLDYFPHTVTACQDPCHDWQPTPSGAFDGDLHLAGDQYTIDTSGLKPGTYHYFCEIHHYMRGEFTVLPKSGAITAQAH